MQSIYPALIHHRRYGTKMSVDNNSSSLAPSAHSAIDYLSPIKFERDHALTIIDSNPHVSTIPGVTPCLRERSILFNPFFPYQD